MMRWDDDDIADNIPQHPHCIGANALGMHAVQMQPGTVAACTRWKRDKA
jgi:hypothetical protein